MLHLVPLGAALDNASQGNYGEAGISLAGDLALLLSGGLANVGKLAGAARALRISGAAVEAGIGVTRATQGVFALREGDNDKALGYFGEATLRLLGVSAAVIQDLKAARAVQNAIGGARMGTGEIGLQGLRDARNLTARLQGNESTCGLHCAASVINDVNPGRGALNLTKVRAQIQANGGKGLNTAELMEAIGKNLPDAAVVPAYNVTEGQLIKYLARGNVITNVDGNHWVRVLGKVKDGKATWLQIYDPARGNYEQLLSSFVTRMGSKNVLIAVIP